MGHGRSGRGLTMIELLVCLAILAFTVGGVVAIFYAGTRIGLTARERCEAGRLAQAIRDLGDRGTAVLAPYWGRDPVTGTVKDGTITNLTSHLTPGWVWGSDLSLVWKAKIEAQTIEGMAVHQLAIIVGVDVNADGMYSDELDTAPDDREDREVARFVSILADRN